LRGLKGQETARGLDLISRRYGKAPHEWMDLSDVEFAFDYEVMTRAMAAEGGTG
jgi:hypothetical protein